MSLQFIIGSSGAGKSYFAYERVIRESMEHPERNYYIIVPEQFTMQTQKTLVEMHPGKGILNIDILSFERLAYRVFEETGGDNRKVLEDTGKSMVLQKMVQQHRKELAYLGSQMNKPGYLDEVKSLVSEFMQYDIREENLAEMKEKAKDQPLLEMKLKDVGIMAYPLEYMEPKLPGLGDVDWGRYVSALTDIGYDGFTCVEVEDRAFESDRERILDSLKLSKRYIEQFVI